MGNYDYWNEDNYIEHYGTKGQKWGERKYQYQDGSLTPEGKIRYGKGSGIKSTSSGASYDSTKLPDGRRVYARYRANLLDKDGKTITSFAQPVGRQTDPDFTETSLKFWFDENRNNINTPQSAYDTIYRRAVNEAERNELMNERAYSTAYNYINNLLLEDQKKLAERQKQQEAKKNAIKYSHEERANMIRSAKNVPIKTIDSYSPSKVNVVNEIKKSYGNALNTYVSGLKSIGSWASNLFKR